MDLYWEAFQDVVMDLVKNSLRDSSQNAFKDSFLCKISSKIPLRISSVIEKSVRPDWWAFTWDRIEEWARKNKIKSGFLLYRVTRNGSKMLYIKTVQNSTQRKSLLPHSIEPRRGESISHLIILDKNVPFYFTFSSNSSDCRDLNPPLGGWMQNEVNIVVLFANCLVKGNTMWCWKLMDNVNNSKVVSYTKNTLPLY